MWCRQAGFQLRNLRQRLLPLLIEVAVARINHHVEENLS